MGSAEPPPLSPCSKVSVCGGRACGPPCVPQVRLLCAVSLAPPFTWLSPALACLLPPRTSHLPPCGQGWPHCHLGAFCPLGTQPLVPTCSLVCALVLRSGATAATQRDLVHRGQQGRESQRACAGLHSLGDCHLHSWGRLRASSAQGEGGLAGSLRPQAGTGSSLVFSHLELLPWVSITVEEILTAPGPARVAMALGCGAQVPVLFPSLSLLGLSPALNPVTQSHERGQGQLRSHCPVRSHLPPHVLGEGKASPGLPETWV